MNFDGEEHLVNPDDSYEEILEKATKVKPSIQKLNWQELEFTSFIHFGMNTFTNSEWGSGKEEPKIFNPVEFNAEQWVRALKNAGMKLLILTAKHHDGFCLWPSDYTDHSVKNSKWKDGKGDIVEEVANACHRLGMKFGIYISPWDRHEKTYGTDEYNMYFKNQLKELLTRYGEITEVWFDGACGEGPNGKKQVYDWQGFWQTVREFQPNAVISVCGPDVRWCGNEEGKCRESEWSVVFVEGAIDKTVRLSTDSAQAFAQFCSGSNPTCMEKDLGSRDKLKQIVGKSGKLVWYPCEVNTSIRPGWFYHESEDDKVKPLQELIDIYFNSVGGNSVFLLNVPPDKRGLIHENDQKRLIEIGNILNETFSTNLAKNAKTYASDFKDGKVEFHPQCTLDQNKETYWITNQGVNEGWIIYDLENEKTFNVVMLQEYIKLGQRIEKFFIDIYKDGDWKQIAQGTTIGYKKLIRMPNTKTNKIRIRITQARYSPAISNFGLYMMKD